MEKVPLVIHDRTYHAEIMLEDNYWIGWLREIKGVNCQAFEKEELLEELVLNGADMIKHPPPHGEPISLIPDYEWIPETLVKKICKDLQISYEDFLES